MVHRPWRDCSSQVWFRCGGPLLATWGAEFGGEDRSKTRCLLHFRWRAEFCWKEGWRFEEDLVATYLSWRYKDTTIESGLCITIIAGFCFFASELWAFAVHFIINFYVQLRWILSLSYRKLARKLRKSGQRGPILFSAECEESYLLVACLLIVHLDSGGFDSHSRIDMTKNNDAIKGMWVSGSKTTITSLSIITLDLFGFSYRDFRRPFLGSARSTKWSLFAKPL